MCLAMPMKVVEVDGDDGVGELGGVRRKISFQLLDRVEVGDYVLVHAGFAISKVDEDDARETIDAMDECCIDE